MSIKEKYITTIQQVSDIIWDQKYHTSMDRNRSSYLYRGMPNVNYHLATSLQRNCKGKKDEIELPMLRNFAKYAAMEDPALKSSVWRKMIVGQHHGLSTRLLDWTYSVMIALHFATSGESLDSMEEHDSVLWQINIEEMNQRLPKSYQEVLNKNSAFLMTVDMLDELTGGVSKDREVLQQYDLDMNRRGMVLLEPPSVDQRIISQYSYFSIVPFGMENYKDDLGIEDFLEGTCDTVKYIISVDLKWRIRDMLDQMNINERIAYPGLDGLTAWLKRHYYVR